ncbi:hypothetical protein BDP55DRAFT_31995 [Colletotrichum godetiae]|uniref:Uncharacterized protein n=1 Tax=Colletotrichum godetiae TaxID=1209918 RepID=A0AAJ0EWJ8_9PEZI|nr:uncharacterized protein BDP55DRAFT_31995 [Colletotrichum godetiae]KAK1688840.1 hypothetical protein BDP55DRAFT_31995 [Colletotrichum godetiae]
MERCFASFLETLKDGSPLQTPRYGRCFATASSLQLFPSPHRQQQLQQIGNPGTALWSCRDSESGPLPAQCGATFNSSVVWSVWCELAKKEGPRNGMCILAGSWSTTTTELSKLPGLLSSSPVRKRDWEGEGIMDGARGAAAALANAWPHAFLSYGSRTVPANHRPRGSAPATSYYAAGRWDQTGGLPGVRERESTNVRLRTWDGFSPGPPSLCPLRQRRGELLQDLPLPRLVGVVGSTWHEHQRTVTHYPMFVALLPLPLPQDLSCPFGFPSPSQSSRHLLLSLQWLQQPDRET